MNHSSSIHILAPLAPWFEAGRRDLPWRAKDLDKPHPDPYAVLVSEVMLQQTQVITVIAYFKRWMERFPTLESLAKAETDEVHRYWQGLGYYRRVTHLQRAAQIIHETGWPSDLAGFKKLPGMGPYTAAALASIAFQHHEPALDGNAFRVLSRLLALQEDPQKCAERLRVWLRPAQQHLGSSRITQAIMELGATLCTPKAPSCSMCPLAANCLSHQKGSTHLIPPPKPRPSLKHIDLCLFAVESENHWLLLPPQQKGLLAGLWQWPSIHVQNGNKSDSITAQARGGSGIGPFMEEAAAESAMTYCAWECGTWQGWIQTYSHRKEHVRPLIIHLPNRPQPVAGLQWISSDKLAELPLGRRDQRLRELIHQPCRHTSLSNEQVLAVKALFDELHPQII